MQKKHFATMPVAKDIYGRTAQKQIKVKPNSREKSLADVIIFNIMSYIKRGDSDERIYNKRIKSNFKISSN